MGEWHNCRGMSPLAYSKNLSTPGKDTEERGNP